MQRIAPNTLPPRGSGGRPGGGGGQGESPAFRMASRIRTEQGADRAAQYLKAMEPFVAPAERAHIAQQLGLSMPPDPPPPQPSQSVGGAAPAQAMPPFGGGLPNLGPLGNLGGLGNMGNLGNLGNIMQMVQLFQGLSGSGGGGGPGNGNPMQLAQMLGSLMGAKKS